MIEDRIAPDRRTAWEDERGSTSEPGDGASDDAPRGTRGRYRAVAWDIDGTLIDSEPLHHRALVAVCGAYGCDLGKLPMHHYRGTHMRDIWLDLKPRLPADLDEDAWLAAIERQYVEGAPSLVEIAGAVATMDALAAIGVPQVCVSNSSRAVVDANLAALGLEDRIEFSISLDDVTRGKPAPEPYSRAAQCLGIPAHQMVAIEDSSPGIAAASAAGMLTLAYCGPGATPPVGGDRAITRLEDVLALFRPQPG